MVSTAEAWLARVRHDLVKRMLWPARDRRDLGGPVREGELVAKLIDEEGQPTRAGELWRLMFCAGGMLRERDTAKTPSRR